MSDAFSLRQSLLIWIIPAVVIMLGLSALGDYKLAVEPAWQAYDDALADAALLLKDRLQSACQRNIDEGMHIRPEEVGNALTGHRDDPFFYSIYDGDGRYLAGSPWLFQRGLLPPLETRRFETLLHRGGEVRYLTYRTHVRGQDFLIQVGEDTQRRKALSQRILLGMLLPELITVLSVIVVVLIGVRRGLAPLEQLGRLVEANPGAASGHLPETRTPREIVGLVHTHNLQASRLAESLSLQETFITHAAHQLRTPLAGLRVQSELARELLRRGPAQPELGHVIEQIHVASSRAIRLVQQLLGLARSQSAPDHFVGTDLAQAAERVAGSILQRALARGIDLGLELAAAPVRANPVLLDELIVNLLDNALNYCPSGSRITVFTQVAGEMAELIVEDDGPGIPESERARVFERFYRLQPEREGVGLGLAIVREIATQHLAEVSLESPVSGVGLRVCVRFPLARETA